MKMAKIKQKSLYSVLTINELLCCLVLCSTGFQTSPVGLQTVVSDAETLQIKNTKRKPNRIFNIYDICLHISEIHRCRAH